MGPTHNNQNSLGGGAQKGGRGPVKITTLVVCEFSTEKFVFKRERSNLRSNLINVFFFIKNRKYEVLLNVAMLARKKYFV